MKEDGDYLPEIHQHSKLNSTNLTYHEKFLQTTLIIILKR